ESVILLAHTLNEALRRLIVIDLVSIGDEHRDDILARKSFGIGLYEFVQRRVELTGRHHEVSGDLFRELVKRSDVMKPYINGHLIAGTQQADGLHVRHPRRKNVPTRFD